MERFKSVKNLTDQQKGSLLAFVAVIFITPDSLFIRLSSIDTMYYPALCDFIKGADLLYHEATFAKDSEVLAKKTKHSTAEQAALIAKKADVKILMLGHYSARYTDLKLLLDEAKLVFENTVLADDGLKINL